MWSAFRDGETGRPAIAGAEAVDSEDAAADAWYFA